jgi:DNA-binding CsgD family transcriptional regulator
MLNLDNELTIREKEVLRRLKHCRTSRDIGSILGISERTVKFHLGNIFRKFGVGSRAQAVAAAMEKGLID